MTRERVAALIARLKLPIVKSDGEGIVIRRAASCCHNPHIGGSGWYPVALFSVWHEERWRIRSCGGIAGRSNEWRIEPFSRWEGAESFGPFSRLRDLETALRSWRRWEQPIGADC